MSLHKSKNYSHNDSSVDLTSLLDVLFIILVFILTGYSGSNIAVNVAEEISLPFSRALGVPKTTLSLQLTPGGSVILEGQRITKDFNDSSDSAIAESIEAAVNELSLFEDQDLETINVNLFIDQDTEYQQVQRFMLILESIGYSNFKFVVQGK